MLDKFQLPGEVAETVLDELSFTVVEEVNENILRSGSSIIVEVQEENYHGAEVQGFGITNETGSYFYSCGSRTELRTLSRMAC
ncbi:hypothetical protein GCM10020331_032580 [Ectobacillus funiculus]